MNLMNPKIFVTLLFTSLSLLLSSISAFETAIFTAANVSISASNATSEAAQNGCYGSGANGNRAWLNDHILTICQQVFGGWYQKGWMGRTACYNTGISNSPKSYWFAIYNMNEVDDRQMDPYGCATFMKKVSDSCSRGGDFAFWDINWRFIADPEQAAWCAQH